MNYFVFMAILLSIASLQPAMAQRYQTALGLRVGGGLGITLQQKVKDKWTIEGILQKKLLQSENRLSMLGEYHQPIVGRSVNFYVGGGPHLIFGKQYDALKNTTGQQLIPGISAIGGLEVPIGRTRLSIDYKPSLNLGGQAGVLNGDLGISLRYVLVKQQRKQTNFLEKIGIKKPDRKR